MYPKLSDTSRGYLDAIMNAQLQIYGKFLIPPLLTPALLTEMRSAMPYINNPDGIETLEYIYSNYFIARKSTEIERINMGAIDYDTIMPLVFQHSDINLNITLRNIQCGIPLRAFDIMGSGGFLLTNYQEDFLNYFSSGEDFVYYSSPDEVENLVQYYLSHEKERQQIAANALGKILESHTFKHRVQTILSLLTD